MASSSVITSVHLHCPTTRIHLKQYGTQLEVYGGAFNHAKLNGTI